ncbi:MAG: TonB-dependent receptor [Dysgonamonadaceae bacterium]|nr:TonB-dependent receptor [Dysgonamonadaceae bacterium]
MNKIKLCLLFALMLLWHVSFGQVTTASMSGRVTDGAEALAGASIVAIHEESGTKYAALTNVDGLFFIQGMKTGGPYRIEVSYIGYKTMQYKDVSLSLGENYRINVQLKEDVSMLGEVVVVGFENSNMRTDRAGAITSVGKMEIMSTPTISRSMNDIMRLSPQSNTTSNGYAVGGGNFRQSYVTVDGAAFNNAFGIGANLPASGSPISLDALEQLSVSITPYDVRQSGFVGGAINAVTRSGDNEFKGTVYTYMNNDNLQGRKVRDYELAAQETKYSTYGLSLGGPIIKNKLFYFINAEYEDNQSAGPSYTLRNSENEAYGENNVRRPTTADVNTVWNELKTKYGYDPGRISNYTVKTPSLRLMGRFDWNINDNNKLNIRLSHTATKYGSNPSSSVSPLTASLIYPGNSGLSINSGNGRTSNYAMYFESSRYFQEQNFSSFAAELNSKLASNLNNMLRFTYSYQNEPRSYVGGTFPTVDILKDGACYMSFGPDPFTAGNTRIVHTYVATDELTLNLGANNITAGLQYEYQNAINGFQQGGNGYYVFASLDDFINGAKPSAFGITHSNAADLSQFQSTLAFKQFAFYLQDQLNLTENFRLTGGLRFELPSYPSIEETNYNKAFADMDFGGTHYSTAQLPKAKLTISPRVGFNWDITGERKYVLRGGTGVFVGRLPYVWLVSVVGNSNVGQTQYYYNNTTSASGVQPDFHTNLNDILSQLYGGSFNPTTPVAPQSPTILSEDLKMPSTWKSSLAFDAKLPYDIDFSLEGIYNNDINPVVVSNRGYHESGEIQLNAKDTRKTYTPYISRYNVYMLENHDANDSYYYAITASLRKKFDFGLDLSFAYTRANSKAYSDGLSDQVTSAFTTNTFSVNGTNSHDLGYGSYVSPDRIIATVGFNKEYARNYASGIYLIYDGSQLGYSGGSYSYTRFSYTQGNVTGDGGANNLLYVPASFEELSTWNFADASGYSGEEQKKDFWAYIEQDKYLSSHKGQYTERGGAVMPWHHQLDFKFTQDFYFNVGGKRNTLQFGLDIQNLPNLLNSSWGLYKTTYASNILSYNTSTGAYSFPKVSGEVLKSTFKDYQSFTSTYTVQLSLRYIFN